MKDHHQNDSPVNPRDLTTQLTRIKKSHSLPNDGDAVLRLHGLSGRQTGTSSTSSSSFTSRVSAEVAPGEFSKPRLHGARRRAKSSSSPQSASKEEFRYYGRHANSWLFNDFSISETVQKGFKKVFSSRGEEEGGMERGEK